MKNITQLKRILGVLAVIIAFGVGGFSLQAQVIQPSINDGAFNDGTFKGELTDGTTALHCSEGFDVRPIISELRAEPNPNGTYYIFARLKVRNEGQTIPAGSLLRTSVYNYPTAYMHEVGMELLADVPCDAMINDVVWLDIRDNAEGNGLSSVGLCTRLGGGPAWESHEYMDDDCIFINVYDLL